MIKARISLPPARCLRQICTGAAQKRFWVNTPATVQPGSNAHQGQVTAIFLADFSFGNTEADAGYRKQLIGSRSGVIDRHSRSSKSIKAPGRCLGRKQ
jgi:hypothetical protein